MLHSQTPFGNTGARRFRSYEKIASNQMQEFRSGRLVSRNTDPRSKITVLSTGPAQAAVTTMFHELDTDARGIEDMGALNRWRGRSSVPIERYVRLWEKSCNEIGAAGWLPRRLFDLLGLDERF